jgi:hypothetical protein
MTFRIEWEPAPGVSHPVLARTWARIEIAIGDTCVTTVLDRQTGGTRAGVYGPTFVVAEWIVRNFWFLLWESVSGPAPTSAWLRRHSLAAAREGTSLPRLECFRDESKIVTKWARDERGVRPVTFIEAGNAELEPAAVQAKLVDFVDLVLERVRALDHPDVVALREDWRAITSATGDDLLVCKRAARMGLDAYEPDEVSDDLASLLTDGVGRLPTPTGDDLLDAAVAPEKFAASIATVADAVRADPGPAPKVTKGTPRFDLGHSKPVSTPYEHGYTLADALRRKLNQSPDGPFARIVDVARPQCEGRRGHVACRHPVPRRPPGQGHERPLPRCARPVRPPVRRNGRCTSPADELGDTASVRQPRLRGRAACARRRAPRSGAGPPRRGAPGRSRARVRGVPDGHPVPARESGRGGLSAISRGDRFRTMVQMRPSRSASRSQA